MRFRRFSCGKDLPSSCFMPEFSRKYPSLWIDNLSFDVVDRDPTNAVRVAIAAYACIKELLEAHSLQLSKRKAGFVVSNATAKRLLRELTTRRRASGA